MRRSRKKEDKARFRKLTGTRRVLGSIQPSQANTQNTVRFDVKSFANDEASVTSGCGPDELVQRTIWRDIHIDEASGPIGNGRFGSVWRASWQDEPVAVKLFNSLHEASWSRETDIYQTSMLRHENILGYIASDIRGGTSPASLMFMIVTDLHPLGSLYDFLLANTLNTRQLLAFLSGVASGLSHLHQEIVGVKYKPSVAHRDLKTKNVLVKAAASGRCCLADFGSAVCDWSTPLSRVNSVDWKQQSVVYGNNVWQQQQGSVRYMAPECLSGALGGANQATTTIEDFKCVDMYAFALVVWELLTRTRFTGSDHDQTSLVVVAHEHRPPYSEYVSGDPPLELMRHLVCDKQMRPATERIDELVAQSSNQVSVYQPVCSLHSNTFLISFNCLIFVVSIKGFKYAGGYDEGMLEGDAKLSSDCPQCQKEAQQDEHVN